MHEIIRRNVRGRTIIPLFVVTSCIYAVMVFITIPRVMSFCGGMSLFDMMPAGYTVEYANLLLAALGQAGRDAYLYTQLPFDMLYPGLFAITYCLILATVLVKLGKFDSLLYYLCFVPVAGGIFDYHENLWIIAMLTTYPDNPAFLTEVTSTFSIMKASCTTVYFIVLIVSLITLAARIVSKRNPPAS
jgi:hypothetical protein